MKTSLFDYQLPKELIAQSPVNPRDHSRLMVIDRKTLPRRQAGGKISHHRFFEIENFLGPNDVLVLNKTKVFPARIFGKKETGGKVEILLHKNIDEFTWEALTKPGLKVGQKIDVQGTTLYISQRNGELSIIKFDIPKDVLIKKLKKIGVTPLPPYINSTELEKDLRTQYQTVYAKTTGSVAAPTAGFHFTKSLLTRLKKKGVQIEYVTLHVGMGTFAPVKTKTLEEHKMHEEEFFVDKKTFERLVKAKKSGKRIISVGTTSTRVLETMAPGKLSGSTNIFIFPPYKFRFVDALITNFHLPKSTLLALISAFVSYPNTKEKFKDFNTSLVGKAYQEAIKNKYRFYSFGDACWIV
jgi:S-adenosylmethionine:tRNA ribosyltransferase-isomerase